MADDYQTHAAALRRGIGKRVEEITADLGTWLDLRMNHVDQAALSIALLEAAIGRYVELHGEADAHELVEISFRKLVARRKAGMQ